MTHISIPPVKTYPSAYGRLARPFLVEEGKAGETPALRIPAVAALPRWCYGIRRPADAYLSGRGLNSVSSGTGRPKRSRFQHALACSMRSLRLETKFHPVFRGPHGGSPPSAETHS